MAVQKVHPGLRRLRGSVAGRAPGRRRTSLQNGPMAAGRRVAGPSNATNRIALRRGSMGRCRFHEAFSANGRQGNGKKAHCAEAAVTHFVFALQLLPRWIKDTDMWRTDDLQPQTCHFCVVVVRSRASISVMNSRECPIEILPFQPLPLDFNPKTK